VNEMVEDAYTKKWRTKALAKRAEIKAEMCEHMTALIAHCQEVRVIFGGCGDCGSAWLVCKHCADKQVENAHEVFAGDEWP
jgi:spermidine synthase